MSIQAAIDGSGVAMGPTALVGDDLAAGRLAPFPETSLPARAYSAYLPEREPREAGGDVFCAWLANMAAAPLTTLP